MEEDEKVTCPECGYQVGTKEDGTKIKAHRVQGVKCAGSDELVPEEIESTGVAAGETFEPSTDDENASQGEEQSDDEGDSGDDSTEPETATHGVATSEGRVFTHVMRVADPCPYVHQADWHLANGKLVEKLARQAGEVPVGEAKFDGMNPGEGRLFLIYTIPVK